MYDEVPPGTKPFDEANKLVFATGPLTGFDAPANSRVNITSLSTFTKRKFSCDAHMGGFLQRKWDSLDTTSLLSKGRRNHRYG
ncbi:aldehyde ferredoxin oxidoreductase N-terminal domain-containing protein [Shigella flexneri]